MSFTPRLLRKSGVIGLPLPGLLRVPRNDRQIFLTFDDGPNDNLTPRLLDILRAHDAKATFFVNGTQVERHPDVAERIAREGHVIANHSYAHRDLTQLAPAAGFAEVERCQQLIQRYNAPRLFRPPHGLLGARLFWKLVRAGYRIIYWTMDSRDSWDETPETLSRRLIENTRPGEVILFHDDRANGIGAVELFLAGASKRGFEFGVLRSSNSP